MSDASNELLAKIVAATGLSSIIATGAVLRCCTRAGIDPRRLTREDLAQMLPTLHAMLRIYLPPDDVAAGMQRLRSIAESK